MKESLEHAPVLAQRVPSSSGKTLIILNPHAGSGRAGRLWSQIEPMLWRELGELVVAITQQPNEVAPHLENARASGLTKVIAIGGDGTNHAIVNELVRLNQAHPDEPKMTFGCLPIGTGQDWARSFGIPLDPVKAVAWIKGAHPVPIDIGHVDTNVINYNFLNIASIGISGEIARRVNNLRRRWPWSFYQKTVEALLWYNTPMVKVHLDGQLWYDGKAYVVAVANGQSFGHGMLVAPNANSSDGLFDVVLLEGIPRLEAIRALSTVYTGDHIKRSDVHVGRARVVEVESASGKLPMELDGEQESGGPVRFEVLPGMLPMLLNSAAEVAPA
ncbi:MAG: diacylglycerol kinase family lipid kinase [Anaerolineae bacterium]|nr:diacylglycerol kinase family lipid kinase [Anaerolineae bacterium]